MNTNKIKSKLIETIIYYNFPNEVDAGDCEALRCAQFKVVYDVSMPQIIALIEQSAECRQFIKVTIYCLLVVDRTFNGPP